MTTTDQTIKPPITFAGIVWVLLKIVGWIIVVILATALIFATLGLAAVAVAAIEGDRDWAPRRRWR